MTEKKLVVTLKKSVIGCSKYQKRTAKALGLTKVCQKVEHRDNSVVRGMLDKIKHLVEVEQI